MSRIYFFIGASGSGKTTLLKVLEKQGWPATFCYFDDINIPKNEEMINEFGGEEEWQRVKTNDWVKKIKTNFLSANDVIFDAQIRPAFIEEVCAENNIDFKIVLIDCCDEVRQKRLIDRGQPDLANEKMMTWARFLREDCLAKNYIIFDNSKFNLEESLLVLKKILVNE